MSANPLTATAILATFLLASCDRKAEQYDAAIAVLQDDSDHQNFVWQLNKIKKGEAGINDPFEGRTALDRAVETGDYELVAFILSAGADPNAQSDEDWEGRAPLVTAVQGGHIEITRELLQRGADPNSRCTMVNEDNSHTKRFDSCPVLFVAVAQGNAAMVKLLVAHGADVKAVDAFGRTALFEVRKDGEGTLAWLLAKGCDPHAADARGRTALHDAALMRRDGIVRALLDAGCKPDVRDARGRTPLHEACRPWSNSNWHRRIGESRDGDTVRVLLEKGVDPNRSDEQGNTPLHEVAQRNDREIARLLIEAGADADAVNKAGKKPWQLSGITSFSQWLEAAARKG